MDIPGLSMAMAQTNTMNDISVALMSKAIDQFDSNGDSLTKMMEQSVTPSIGSNIDISL